jgi:predicted site-specific integrase-resolvase
MKAKEVKKILEITQPTLSYYVTHNMIRVSKINPYHYIYNDQDVLAMAGKAQEATVRYNVTYSRVSLPKQKNDLVSQKQRLYNFAISSGIKIEKELSDVKSGMNFSDRKDFNMLLSEVITGKIDTVVIENKDRLARFGFELIEKLFGSFNTKIIVVSNADNISYEQELTQDLISIIHHFSMKSYSNRRKLNKLKQDLLNNTDNDEQQI